MSLPSSSLRLLPALLLWIALPRANFAQTAQYEQITIEQGLSQGIIFDLHQALPTFHPIAEHEYDIKDSLADMNMNKVLIDKVGRLHIETDGQGDTALGKWYEYNDGTRAYLSRLKLSDHQYHYFQMEGKDATGRIYEFVHYRQEDNGL